MKKLFFLFILCIFISSNVFAFYEGTVEEEEDYVIETSASIEVPSLNARSALLYDVTGDRILYEKNSRQRRANASTTKMITALVAYKLGNLGDIVTISQKAANTGGSTINLRAGDKVSLGDLLKGLLVHSGNDAAVAIAEHIAGSVDNFIVLMNEEAEEIGAVDSHFITPHGLDAENHYSTAYDLMLIARKLISIPFFANIVSQKTVNIKINNNTRTIGTTNEMLSLYEGSDGIKTGFTGDAGRCLITSCTKDGRRLISIVLGCDSKKFRTSDSVKLLDYGFNAFKNVNLGKYIRDTICVNIKKSEGGLYSLSKKFEIIYPLKDEELSKIEVKYHIKSDLNAPLEEGEEIGYAEIFLDNVKIKEVNYILPQKIERKNWKSYFKEFLLDKIEKF